jgi:hypothetical protein
MLCWGLRYLRLELFAVSCDPLTKVVAKGLPFQFTTEEETKPVPFTVIVKPALPGVVASGTSGLLMSGTGFDWASTNVLSRIVQKQISKSDFMAFSVRGDSDEYEGTRLVARGTQPCH